MYGLQAISACNGWAITFLGVTIVFSGLVCLSIIISQLPKLLDVWDNRFHLFSQLKVSQQNEVEIPPPITPQADQNFIEAIRNFKVIVQWLGESPFSLPKLLDLAEKRGISQPHSTLNQMLHEKIIYPDGNGYYLWQDKPEFQL